MNHSSLSGIFLIVVLPLLINGAPTTTTTTTTSITAAAGRPSAETFAYHTEFDNQYLPLLNEYQERQRENCKYLCGGCGCQGYYCGDECICQCNRADESNVKCIQYMKNKSQKMAYPFEVLIQGPAGRRFVREVSDIDPETMAAYQQNERSGRSVYSIYKPTKVGKGDLMAVADGSSDPTVASIAAPLTPSQALAASAKAKLAEAKAAAEKSAASLKSKLRSAVGVTILGSADPSVGAPAPDPTVGAPAPAAAAADPTVGAPAPAAASSDPTVGAPAPAAAAADPTVGAPAPAPAAADPVVGNAQTTSSITTIFKGLPKLAVPAVNWPKGFVFKGLSTPLVGSPIIVQPESTL